MSDPKPAWSFDLKQIVSILMALTALVTAITSLVKALDKRLEQASYEALSASILSIQKEQALLLDEVQALKPKDQDGDGIPDDEDPTSHLMLPAPSTSAMSPIGPPPPATSPVASVAPSASTVHPSTRPTGSFPAPVATDTPWILRTEPSPGPKTTHPHRKAISSPPPEWNDVKSAADKL
jgi:hypothetical protein